ncbi:DUF2931 family protein [Sphingobacterium sp. MYb382]|uniref:DUF2931 family protein n=1 Tax=Sphingobacterium sp. MYb382 TaxID=2745278 RepID=UPI00309B4203
MDKGRFSYSTTFSAPKEYPAEVYYGYFANKEKTKIVAGVPKAGMANDSWQYDGAEAGQGGSSIPAHLHLVYVAYAEKKFYEVDAALPVDKILALFKEGFLIKDKQNAEGNYPWVPDTYDVLTVGAAPGGIVVVWLSGNHHRREICRLQAKEVEIDKNKFLPYPDLEESQQDFFESLFKITVPKSVQLAIEENGIPYGLWDKYRLKYRYRFVLDSYKEDDYLEQIYRINYNGEADYLRDSTEVDQYRLDAIPYNVTFSSYKNNTEITFDDGELMKAFRELRRQYPDDPIDVVIRPKFRYKDFEIFVQCRDQRIQLKKIVVEKSWGIG